MKPGRKKGSIPWNKGLSGHLSESTLKRMSDSHNRQVPWIKGKKMSNYTRELQSNAHRGKTLSEIHKRAISIAMKGRKISDEWREKIRKSNIGKKMSEEAKKKMSIQKINNPVKNRRFYNTKPELQMKELLNKLGVHYVFQYPLENIALVDFYVPEKKLVIECDGCYWHGCPIHFPTRAFRQEKDLIRDSKLESLGYSVIRFWEHEINSMKILNI